MFWYWRVELTLYRTPPTSHFSGQSAPEWSFGYWCLYFILNHQKIINSHSMTMAMTSLNRCRLASLLRAKSMRLRCIYAAGVDRKYGNFTMVKPISSIALDEWNSDIHNGYFPKSKCASEHTISLNARLNRETHFGTRTAWISVEHRNLTTRSYRALLSWTWVWDT